MTATPTPQAVRASEWPAPAPARLRGLGLTVGVLVCLHAVAALAAAGVLAWGLGETPAWLTEEVQTRVVAAAEVSLVVTGLAWAVWQYRVVRSFPPGTPRGTPGWHLWSWLIPVGAWWLPYRNLSDLFRCSGLRRPRWMLAWWVLWVIGLPLSTFGRALALEQAILEQPVVGLSTAAAWTTGAGSLLLAAAAPPAFLLVRRLSTARSTGR